MKTIIYTHYKNPPEKRGTLNGDTFHRDNTPVVMGWAIGLEIDVVEQLELHGCKYLTFNIRGIKNQIKCKIEDFRNAITRRMGIPPREQYFLDYEKFTQQIDKTDLFLEK